MTSELRDALFSVPFSQLPAAKKNTENGAAVTSYFLMTLPIKVKLLRRVI